MGVQSNSPRSSVQVSELVERVRLDEPGAADGLVAAVYSELRRIAGRYMRGERFNHTLQPTALVNEAYLRLFPNREADWKDHVHLVSSAARAMRQVLVDHARKRNRLKRGGDLQQVTFHSSAVFVCDQQPRTLLALDEALSRLEELDPRAASMVELLYFSGLNQKETARALGISPRTVNREWRLARNWLQDEISRIMSP